MRGPRHGNDYPDRALECQEDLEARVITIIDEGRAAGWSVRDITAALVALADNLMLADEANAETGRQIAEAMIETRRR